MSVVKLYLFRHGEVENSESKVFNGHRDVSLSGEGVRQFEEIPKRIKKKKN
ncbi:MAG: phosphoglycerate mutase family protein [Nitrospinota bacterium]